MLDSGLSIEIFTLRNPALAMDLAGFKSMRVALVVINKLSKSVGVVPPSISQD